MSLLPIWCLVVVLALVPFPGRWAMLKVVLPALVVAGTYLWNKDSLASASLGKPNGGWWKCAGLGLLIALAKLILSRVLIQPLVRQLSDEPKDLSLFDPMEGNLGMLAMYLAFMWVIAAFGEEFIWRGFLLRRLFESKSRILSHWLVAIPVCAVLWGVTHAFQGPSGIVEKSLAGVVFGALYVWSGRTSIWLVVFVHGFGNTISFVAIYLGVYDALYLIPR